MFFKKRKKSDMDKIDADKITTGVIKEKPATIRVINGKLYDTSKATHICDLRLWRDDIPDYDLFVYNLFGEDVSLYKGNSEWFITLHGNIKPVTEEWVQNILGYYRPDKYIEFFGEPELA